MNPSPFIDDILTAIPQNNISAWAERSLRTIARIADEHANEKIYYCEFDERTQVGTNLLIAACIIAHIKHTIIINGELQEIEEPCLKSYRFEGNKLFLEFNKNCERPPIRAIWAKMDELKLILMKCYERIEEGPYEGEYAVLDTIDTPLDVIGFTHEFSEDGDLPAAFYDLPNGVTFTDSQGEEFEGRVTREVIEEYLTSHLHEELPNNSVDDIEPCALIISAKQFQRIIDEIGIGIEAGRRPS